MDILSWTPSCRIINWYKFLINQRVTSRDVPSLFTISNRFKNQSLNVITFGANVLLFEVNRTHMNHAWLDYLTCHFQMPNELIIFLGFCDKSKSVYFQPVESNWISDFLYFNQLLLNLTVYYALYIAWHKLLFLSLDINLDFLWYLGFYSCVIW